MAQEKKWIQDIHMKKGALTAKAKAAGMSIDQYCAQDGLSLQSKKQCSLARTLRSFKKK